MKSLHSSFKSLILASGLFSLLCIGLSAPAHADATIQLQKGMLSPSGKLQVKHSSSISTSSMISPQYAKWGHGVSLKIEPGINYFITDQLSLGINIQFYKNLYTSAEDSDLWPRISANLNAKYYFKSKGTVIPFAGLHGGLGHAWSQRFDASSTGVSLGGSAGVLIALSSHFGLELGLESTYSKSKASDRSYTSESSSVETPIGTLNFVGLF